MIYTSDQR